MFDEGPGTSESRKGLNESTFCWMNRFADEHVRASCRAINKWLRDLPEPVRLQKTLAMTSGADHQFTDTVFELYVGALLRHAGFDCVPEYPLPDGCVADMLLRVENKDICLVEMTVNHGIAKHNKEDRARDRLLEEIGARLKCRGCFIDLRHYTVGNGQASSIRIGRAFQAWLDDGCPLAKRYSTDSTGAIDMEYAELDTPSEIVDSKSGWSFSVKTIPTKDPSKVVERPFGCMSGEFRWGQMIHVREDVRDKLTQCKASPLPVVVAVGFSNGADIPDAPEVEQNLFGDIEYWATKGSSDCAQGVRVQNGLWTHKGRTARDRAPAVLVVPQFYPWALRTAEPVLWSNPWKPLALLDSKWKGPKRSVNLETGKRVIRIAADGATLPELLLP